jgi:hypothetical protein
MQADSRRTGFVRPFIVMSIRSRAFPRLEAIPMPVKLPLQLSSAAVALALAGHAAAHHDVTTPNGGEALQVGAVHRVEWIVTIPHATQSWDVHYSRAGLAGPWIPIALGLPPGGINLGDVNHVDWIVPDDLGATARVRVRMSSPGLVYDDTSDADFAIVASLGVRFCANAAPNSTGSVARIHATGSALAMANDLRLTTFSLPTNSVGFFLNSRTQGNVPGAGGAQGTLCLGGAIGRYSASAASSGSAGVLTLELDLGALPTPTGPAPALAGQTWSFQCWHRDANPGPTSNFSDAVAVTFG